MFYLDFDEEQVESNEASNTSQQQAKPQSSTVVATVAKKKIEKNADHRYFYDIPDYLSESNTNFTIRFFSELRYFRNPIDFKDLQELAVLTHQTFIIHSHQKLWHCFLQTGQGLLSQQRFIPDHTNFTATLSFWPQIVTSIMMAKGILPSNNNDNNNDHQSNRQDQNIYINFIQNYLHQLEQQAKQRELKFYTILKRLTTYSDQTIAERIEACVTSEESRFALQLHFKRRIALLEYICTDRSYQVAYFQEKPTDMQVCSSSFCSIRTTITKYSFRYYFSVADRQTSMLGNM